MGVCGVGIHVGVILGCFWFTRGYIGITLVLLWDYSGITLGEWAVPSVCFIGGYYGSYYFINIRHLLTFLVSGVLFFTIVCMWKMAVVLPLLVHDVTTPHHTNAPRASPTTINTPFRYPTTNPLSLTTQHPLSPSLHTLSSPCAPTNHHPKNHHQPPPPLPQCRSDPTTKQQPPAPPNGPERMHPLPPPAPPPRPLPDRRNAGVALRVPGEVLARRIRGRGGCEGTRGGVSLV